VAVAGAEVSAKVDVEDKKEKGIVDSLIAWSFEKEY